METQESLIQRDLSNYRMPRSMLAEIYKEFPWLQEWIARESERPSIYRALAGNIEVEQIYISGIDLSFPARQPIAVEKPFRWISPENRPRLDGLRDPEPGWYYEEIYLVGADGKTLSYDATFVRKKYFVFGKKIESPGKCLGVVLGSRNETVDDIMMQFGDSVVTIRYAISYLPLTRALIIYKAPGKMTLFDQIFELGSTEKAAASEASLRLKAQLAAIDGG